MKTENEVVAHAQKYTMFFDAELRALYRLAEGAHSALEIGAWTGGSTVVLASQAQLVLSIDPHEGMPDTTQAEGDEAKTVTIEPLRRNLQRAGIAHRVLILACKSDEAQSMATRLAPYELVLIDGSHREEDAYQDLAHYGALARRYLVVDDVSYETVGKAVERWQAHHGHHFAPVDMTSEFGIIDPPHDPSRARQGFVGKMRVWRVL